MQTWTARSKFQPPDIRDYYNAGNHGQSFNDRAHQRDRAGQHISRLLYTSKATLDTTAGSPFYPWFGGRIIGFRANCVTAPVTNPCSIDLLKDGTSILGSSDYLTIPAGSLFGYLKHPPKQDYIYKDAMYQWQVVTVSSTGGPLVLVIEIIPG